MKLHNLKAHRNLIIILVIIKIVLIVWFTNVKENLYTNNSEEAPMMNVMIYLQDKEAVLYSDCGVTYPKEITITKTKAVANASLTYLFENELSQYGSYESVVIKDGVAQITLLNENDPNGYKIAGLSSCESRHLFAVLNETLTQYETINSVELYSLSGKIEF
jgi:hypothetical protein